MNDGGSAGGTGSGGKQKPISILDSSRPESRSLSSILGFSQNLSVDEVPIRIGIVLIGVVLPRCRDRCWDLLQDRKFLRRGAHDFHATGNNSRRVGVLGGDLRSHRRQGIEGRIRFPSFVVDVKRCIIVFGGRITIASIKGIAIKHISPTADQFNVSNQPRGGNRIKSKRLTHASSKAAWGSPSGGSRSEETASPFSPPISGSMVKKMSSN